MKRFESNPNPASAPIGDTGHRIRKGEDVFQLARRLGFHWETIWGLPENEGLRETRDPELLLPGDRVYFPPKRERSEDAATAERTTFRRRGQPLEVTLQVCEEGEELGGREYLLDIEGRIETGRLADDGTVRAKVRASDVSGRLEVQLEEERRVFELRFGDLDPPETRSGARQRLVNLGWLGEDSLDDGEGDELELAIAEFQTSLDLEVTGRLDAETACRLRAEHGS